MERRRVVITGLGAVTPLGLTVPESWRAVREGVCGVGPITAYDPAGMKVQLAAEVKGFDPGALFGKPEAKRMGRFTQFALAAANALGELMSYYQLNEKVQGIFVGMPGGKLVFLIVVVLFFMFVGTFMDAVPAMILFVPIILPSATALGVSPIILGLIVVVTLALGLVTPPYGLCLLLAGSISGISIEESFKGVLPYFLSSIAVLALMIVFSDVFLAIPAALFPNLF